MAISRKRHDARGYLRRAALQDRLGGKRMQKRTRDHLAVRRGDPVAELDRGPADDRPLALELLDDRSIAAQHVHVRYHWYRVGANAEVDQMPPFLGLELPRQQAADRRQELAVQHLAE